MPKRETIWNAKCGTSSHWRESMAKKKRICYFGSAVLRTCKVSVTDMRDIEHSIDVTAETLYEAIAAALAALQQDSWVEEIAQGLNTVSVLVQQPPVKHDVKMKDFLSWLGRPGGSPAEVALRERVRKLLVKTNASEITKSR
jgi:post-segregation antitoxin (ccd killing protein)